MSRSRIFLCAGWTAGAMLGGASAAAPSSTASASTQVVESMAVGTLTAVRTSRLNSQVTTQFGSSVSATTMVGISGRPNQAYSIRLPQSDASRSAVNFENMTAWSDNAQGNIATGYSTRMDDNGRDVLRVAGDLRLPRRYAENGTTASMTLGIDYQ